jgi:hypothetical protein
MEDESASHWTGRYTLNEEGDPVPERDLLIWAKWLEEHKQHLAHTRFLWGRVSTIFLGLDQGFDFGLIRNSPLYKPLIWETMVFGGTLDLEQWRYRSRAEALAGHRRVVQECKAAEKCFLGKLCWNWENKRPGLRKRD